MSDFKFYPSEFPKPLQSGYSSKHRPNMLRTSMSDGYVRQRLVNQGAPDIVSVQIMLNENQYKRFLRWYKADIQCGASWFVMPLLAVDDDFSIQYRYVRIQNGEFTAGLITTNTADGSIYRVSMNLDVSNTIVDDGSWSPDTPTGTTDDIIGDVVSIPDSQIVSDIDDLGDSSGTYSIAEE